MSAFLPAEIEDKVPPWRYSIFFYGVFLGLNRDLQGKLTGVRTLGLLGLGSALAVAAFGHANIADASRVVQGIVTGIGFWARASSFAVTEATMYTG